MNGKQKKVHVEARSLEHALVKAAGELETTQGNIEYEITKQTGTGMLSFFFGQKVEINAWRKNSQRSRTNERQERGDRPSRFNRGRERNGRQVANDSGTREKNRPSSQVSAPEQKRQLSQDEVKALVKDIKDFCHDVCFRMTGEETTVTSSLENDRLILNVENEYLVAQAVKNPRFIEAMEHLLRKKPHHLKQELPFRIFLDMRGERRKREQELIQMAKDLSNKVYENQRPIVLNYKNSYDRKIIHMALDKDNRVYTKSIGLGSNRKLMILPTVKQDGSTSNMNHYEN